MYHADHGPSATFVEYKELEIARLAGEAALVKRQAAVGRDVAWGAGLEETGKAWLRAIYDIRKTQVTIPLGATMQLYQALRAEAPCTGDGCTAAFHSCGANATHARLHETAHRFPCAEMIGRRCVGHALHSLALFRHAQEKFDENTDAHKRLMDYIERSDGKRQGADRPDVSAAAVIKGRTSYPACSCSRFEKPQQNSRTFTNY